jgi:fatty-acyl-CoA synthase
MDQFNVGTLLTRQAQRHPDKSALVFEGRTFSFREFNQRSNKWANAFVDLGLRKGQRVGILLPNRNEFLETFFGLTKIGTIPVLLNSRLTPSELEYICKDSAISSLIFDGEFSQKVETMKPMLEVDEYVGVGSQIPSWTKDAGLIGRYDDGEPELAAAGDDPAVILYTSGTTGHPKGVVRNHSSYLWLSREFMATLDSRHRRVLVVVPLSYGWGLNFAITAVDRGDTLVLMKAFNALDVLEVIREEKVDTLLAVRPMLHRMALVPNFETYLSSLRTLETTEPIPPQLREKYLRQGIMMRRSYGLAEMGFVTLATGSDILKKPESEGFPLSCVEMRVVSENGVDLPAGEIGEIIVRSPAGMNGYWNNPEATEKVIRDGWFHTGDLGKLDEDGCVYIAGRIKDVIMSGGEIVSPSEVEKVLHQHPKILEAAVIGLADTVWGEKVCAIIRPKGNSSLTPGDVIAFCHGKLAHFMIPKEVVLTNAPLPYDALSGKLLRKELRERLFDAMARS